MKFCERPEEELCGAASPDSTGHEPLTGLLLSCWQSSDTLQDRSKGLPVSLSASHCSLWSLPPCDTGAGSEMPVQAAAALILLQL